MQTEGQVPKVELKDSKSAHSKDLLKDMIEQTEQYRIDKVLAMMYGGYEDKVRKKSLDYMLKVWEKLSPDQCQQVVNQANQMLNAAGTDNEIKIGVAVALKTFVGVKQTKKGEQDKSFEQIRTDGGLVDIDQDEFF
jgi:hypothetical protein